MTTHGLLCIGDSKTDGDAWVTLLATALETATGQHWTEQPLRLAFGGAQTGDTTGANPELSMTAYLDANLPNWVGTANVCVVNLGVNDSTNPLVEAVWKADMMHIVDSVRAKWPAVQVYIARSWSRGGMTRSNTIASWIADIVASYPSGVHLGHDERVWLENGDDGATYTSDGIHYNAVAQPVVAAQWLTALGY